MTQDEFNKEAKAIITARRRRIDNAFQLYENERKEALNEMCLKLADLEREFRKEDNG